MGNEFEKREILYRLFNERHMFEYSGGKAMERYSRNKNQWTKFKKGGFGARASKRLWDFIKNTEKIESEDLYNWYKAFKLYDVLKETTLYISENQQEGKKCQSFEQQMKVLRLFIFDKVAIDNTLINNQEIIKLLWDTPFDVKVYLYVIYVWRYCENNKKTDIYDIYLNDFKELLPEISYCVSKNIMSTCPNMVSYGRGLITLFRKGIIGMKSFLRLFNLGLHLNYEDSLNMCIPDAMKEMYENVDLIFKYLPKESVWYDKKNSELVFYSLIIPNEFGGVIKEIKNTDGHISVTFYIITYIISREIYAIHCFDNNEWYFFNIKYENEMLTLVPEENQVLPIATELIKLDNENMYTSDFLRSTNKFIQQSRCREEFKINHIEYTVDSKKVTLKIILGQLEFTDTGIPDWSKEIIYQYEEYFPSKFEDIQNVNDASIEYDGELNLVWVSGYTMIKIPFSKLQKISERTHPK